MQPETIFTNRLGKRIKALPNSWFIKIQMVALTGIPDWIGCINGRFIALEVKTNEKEVNAKRATLQRYIIRQLVQCGAYAKFVYPENIDRIVGELDEIAHSNNRSG